MSAEDWSVDRGLECWQKTGVSAEDRSVGRRLKFKNYNIDIALLLHLNLNVEMREIILKFENIQVFKAKFSFSVIIKCKKF